MTIAAAYLTSEGVVLGADSTQTVSKRTQDGEVAVVQLLNHAQKVFEVGPPGEGRYGFATWGAGGFGTVSHRTLAAQAIDKFGNEPVVSHAKDQFIDLVQPLVNSHLGQGEIVGYFFGGVNEHDRTAECYELVFTPHADVQEAQLSVGDAKFGGKPSFFARVFWGHDPDLREKLKHKLEDNLPQTENFDQIYEQCFAEAANEVAAAGTRDLPIREAIDYTHMYLHITIKALKFQYGPPVCGGPIEVGFITSDRRFRWASHKTFRSSLVENFGAYDG